MTNTQSRRAMTVGFSVVTLILLLASTAMACTVFRGTMIVTPLAAGSGVSQATGGGDDMTRCNVSNGATIPITGGQVKVAVKAATTTCQPIDIAQLTGGTYTVNYASSGASDCMTVGGTGAPLGTFTVDSNGAGSTTVTIPGISSHVANTIALCVTSTKPTGLAEGNQVSLTVI